jgi:ABC-type multidrug transport system fused ATPase/permease subunit
MLPNLIPAVCFATFIGRGGTLDLGTAVLSLTYFGKLSWTQNWFPNFLTNYHEMLISFDRIEEFLNIANVQEGLKLRLPEDDPNAIEIKGDFSWGLIP